MKIFSYLSIVLILLRQITCTSLYRLYDAATEVKRGNFFNHSHPIASLNVPNSGYCALKCDQLGPSECRSFNVLQEENGLTCELFEVRGSNLTEIVKKTDARFFESVCDRMVVLGAVQTNTSNGDFVTLIDDKRNVYRHRSGEKLKLLGTVFDVFDHYQGRIDDFGFMSVKVFGYMVLDLYFIRDDMIINCFEMKSEKFILCPDMYGFPRPVELWMSAQKNSNVDETILMIISPYETYNIYSAIVVWSGHLSISVMEPTGLAALELGESLNIACGQTEDTIGFCSWETLWKGASCGFTPIRDKNKTLLFVGTMCYVFDFRKKSPVERHQVCLDEINDFLL